MLGLLGTFGWILLVLYDSREYTYFTIKIFIKIGCGIYLSCEGTTTGVIAGDGCFFSLFKW